jgi:hypothetical protein
VVVRNHPPGWTMPVRPLRPPGGIYSVRGQQLVAVDRGPVAKGPWAFEHGFAPRPDHQQALNLNGRTVAPVGRVDVRPQALTAARGTAPGSRAFLGGTSPAGGQRVNTNSTYMWGANPPRAVESPNGRPPQAVNQQPNVGYPAQSYNQRSTYVARPTPTTHYSAPPPPQHYSAPPPAPHVSAPGAHR